MIVMKFGGTSVKDAQTIAKVAKIIKSKPDNTLVVVSAQAGVTDNLLQIISYLRSADFNNANKIADKFAERHINCANELKLNKKVSQLILKSSDELKQIIYALSILGEISSKSKDKILSFGEDLSVLIVSEYLKKSGLKVKYINSRELIKTDDNFTEANVDIRLTQQAISNSLANVFGEYNCVITQGFIGSTKDGDTTTLGRGGSDYSASLIASFLITESLEIWTDVDGIMTSDPRYISNVRLIKKLTYDEASELAYFGAKILHPKTIVPAVNKKIPVGVFNTFNPDNSGTYIIGGKSGSKIIKAIAFRRDVTVINIVSNRMLGAYGFLGKVFEVFNKYQTPVDIVTTSEVSISLTIDDSRQVQAISDELRTFSKIAVKKNMAIIAAIGEGIRNTAGIAARFFDVLKGININMVSIGSSEVNLSIVLAEKDLYKALQLLHNEFFGNLGESDIFYKLK